MCFRPELALHIVAFELPVPCRVADPPATSVVLAAVWFEAMVAMVAAALLYDDVAACTQRPQAVADTILLAAVLRELQSTGAFLQQQQRVGTHHCHLHATGT